MYRPILVFLIILISHSSCSSLKTIISEPTNLETVSALRDVLNSSTFRAINTLRKVNKGGVESLLPKEIQPVLANLKKLGLGNEVDKITRKIGQASEVVAQESSGIMKDAISELKFKDAVAVVLGGENAATGALKNVMYSAVKKRYSSRLEEELGKSEALQYWPMATTAYNLFAKNKVESSLPDFLAERAVDGLFLTMGKEETKIRKNPSKLGNAVVTKVFDYYQKKRK